VPFQPFLPVRPLARIAGRQVAFIRGEYLWEPAIKLPPGNHFVNGGSYYVFPPGGKSRFFRLDVRGNERQMTMLDPHSGPLTRPKPTKRVWPTNPRQTSVSMDLGTQVTPHHAFLPHDGGPVRISAGGRELVPVRSVVENFYARGPKGKPKVLNRLTVENERPTAEINTMLERFSHLYAVDTNTYVHHTGKRIWITSVCTGLLSRMPPDQLLIDYRHHETFFGPEQEGNPEISGWVAAIQRLLPPGDHDPPPRVGLIVDAFVQRHDQWNSGAVPLYENLHLPLGWQLIYATSDAGSQEFIPNAMIAACHRASTLAFREMNKTTALPT
jgi:hypothetical protein